MKKIKKRIKRFLALWLKDELLDISGLGRMQPMVIPVHPNIKELQVDFVIRDGDWQTNRFYITDSKRVATEKLFDEFLKYIKFDSYEILHPYNRGSRFIGKIYIVDK